MQKWLTPPQAPDLRVVGGNWAPTRNPVALVTLEEGTATYATLYTILDAQGVPRTAVYGGSWGALVPALGARR